MEIKRCYDTIVGASVGENQLVQSGDTSVTVPNGHKYYSKINGTETLGASTGTAIAINDSAKDMVIDLSLYLPANIVDYIYNLESATAGSGISKMREWGFLRGYQAYNAGTIESVEVTEKVVRGFNQWDEEWEVGGYTSSTGGAVALTDRIRGKNYIPVIPSATYYFAMPSSASGNIFFYDANKAFLSSRFLYAGTFSIPSNAYYLHIAMQPTYGTTYNHDICINLSNPDRNGEYEAYVAQSYDYGDDVLNGIFKLDANNNLYADGDVKTSDGEITRKYRIVDLGTLNYGYVPSATRFNADLSGIKRTPNVVTKPNIICAKYETSTLWSTWDTLDKVISVGNDGDYIAIRDTDYTDATAFKAAMSGVMLVYELATPITEQSTPFTSPQVCYPDGTEEYITGNGVPVGHETRYEL